VQGQQDFHDREAGATALVSRRPDSAATAGSRFSSSPALNADDRYVAFRSLAVDLVAGHVNTNDGGDVFLFERETGAVTLVSRTAAAATTGNERSGLRGPQGRGPPPPTTSRCRPPSAPMARFWPSLPSRRT
jgi:hypothetical protein